MATWLLETREEYEKEKLIELFLDEFAISPYEATVLEGLREEPLKIEEVRGALKKLHLKPQVGEKSALLILGADTLSLAVANTLLKTLEEPPSYLEIGLVAQNPKRLPQTVLSRSQPLNLGQGKIKGAKTKESIGEKTSLSTLLEMPIDELFAISEKIAKAQLTAQYLTEWLKEIRRGLDRKENESKLETFRLLATNLRLLENSNLNQRLLLETLFLKLHANLGEFYHESARE